MKNEATVEQLRFKLNSILEEMADMPAAGNHRWAVLFDQAEAIEALLAAPKMISLTCGRDHLHQYCGTRKCQCDCGHPGRRGSAARKAEEAAARG